VFSRREPSGRRVQLHRALSKLGWGSRTQAWEWIRAGAVRVDGRVVTDPLTWVDLDRQHVTRDGRDPTPVSLTLAVHKPPDVVTTRRDERGRRTVYDLLPPGLPWVFPAGRLDADSEGLLILTTDSALAVRLTAPEHHVPKTYHVTLAGRPTEAALDALRRPGAPAPGGGEDEPGGGRPDGRPQPPDPPHDPGRGAQGPSPGARGHRGLPAGRPAPGSVPATYRHGSPATARRIRRRAGGLSSTSAHLRSSGRGGKGVE
jgi:hypothetical protein